MNADLENDYNHIRNGGAGYYEQKRGWISVWGNEAVQFLDGLMSNDMKTLEDGGQMLAAFPNAEGRLLAVVCVQRQGERFLFETEDVSCDKVYQNLFRFTFAGDFFVEDLSNEHSYFEIFGPKADVYDPNVGEQFPGSLVYELPYGAGYFVPNTLIGDFRESLVTDKGCVVISDELHEILRIENGVPKYGVDMDETTIVPELGLDDLISYKKGCYIGQEIIARIDFRGHVAKRLTGLVLSGNEEKGGIDEDLSGLGASELMSPDGKNGGRITSVTFSPGLKKPIALAYVRYDYLAEGRLLVISDHVGMVKDLPFVS